MGRHKIFISYSKKDRKYKEELRRQLASFDADLISWTDQDIQPGDGWDRKIREAMAEADVAVLFVSPDFLATGYVTDVEIPLLMEAAGAERLVLAPLFVRSSNADAKTFDNQIHPATGAVGRVKITDFQGLNRPDLTLAEMSDGERDKALANGTRRLWERLQARPSRQEKRRTTASKSVTVGLRIHGEHLDRAYSLPGSEVFLQKDVGLDLRQLHGLRRNDPTAFENQLFALLFGPEDNVSRVLARVMGREGAPLRFSGVRTRILTDAPELVDLPWAQCRWRGHSLADQGWTFELVSEADRPPPVKLDAPCTALMIGAETDDSRPLRVDAHAASFRGLLDRAWDNPVNPYFFQHASTVEDAEARLLEGPTLIYVYARAAAGSSGLELLLPDASGQVESLPFERLATLVAARPPKVLVMLTLDSCPPVPPLPGNAVVLHLRHDAPSFEAHSQSMAFWNDILEGRWDPVRAFHELGADARTRGTLRTSYEVFETRVADHTPKTDRPRSRLDRTVQREAVMGIVRNLVKRTDGKVACVVAYGSNGNLVEHFAVQVMDTLKDWARNLARLQRHGLGLPNGGAPAELQDFEERFRDLFHLQPERELDAAFAKPKRGGPRSAPVHFLDWGCYGTDLPLPNGPTLKTWLTFCCERLKAAVTGPERILSFVALVLPNEKHEGLERFLASQREQQEFRGSHFEIHLLQPLKKIKPDELRAFLSNNENTSCPPDYRHDIADRICQKTGGEFEETVALLERAEHGHLWPELNRTLPEAQKVEPLEDF